MGRKRLSFVVLSAESVNFSPQGIFAELGKGQPQRWPRQGDHGITRRVGDVCRYQDGQLCFGHMYDIRRHLKRCNGC